MITINLKKIVAILTLVISFIFYNISIETIDKISFYLILAQSLWLELVVIILIIFIYAFADEIASAFSIKNLMGYILRSSDNLVKKTIRVIIPLSLSLMILALCVHTAKARYIHYKNILNSYKYYLYSNLCQKINEKKFDEAVVYGKGITNKYAEEKDDLDAFIYSLDERIKIANIYNNSSKFLPESDDKSIVNRQRYVNLICSYAINPNNSNYLELKSDFELLKENQYIAKKFIIDYKSGRITECVSTLSDYGWFLFEDSLLQEIFLGGNINKQNLNRILSNKSEDMFVYMVKKSWMLEDVQKLLEWKINLKLGESPQHEE